MTSKTFLRWIRKSASSYDRGRFKEFRGKTCKIIVKLYDFRGWFVASFDQQQVTQSSFSLEHSWIITKVANWLMNFKWKLNEFFMTIPRASSTVHEIQKQVINKKILNQKFIIPKLCKTKYKALRLRNPSVMLGAALLIQFIVSSVTTMIFFYVVLAFEAMQNDNTKKKLSCKKLDNDEGERNLIIQRKCLVDSTINCSLSITRQSTQTSTNQKA